MRGLVAVAVVVVAGASLWWRARILRELRAIRAALKRSRGNGNGDGGT